MSRQFSEKFYQENILFTAAPDLQPFLEVLKPLQIASFCYERIYRDRSFFELHSNVDYKYRYYKEGFLGLGRNSVRVQNGVFLGHWLNPQKHGNPDYLILTQECHLSADNLMIVECYPEYREFFYFRKSNQQNDQIYQLFNDADILKQFSQSFKWKAHDLIQKASQPKFRITPLQACERLKQKVDTTPANKNQLTQMLKITDLKRLYLEQDSESAYLTRREIDILDLLTKEKTVSGVARQLSCTQNTMEWHMKRIKEKLGAKTLFSLGLKIGEMDMAHLLTPSKK